jgi:hypothetical protein
MPFSAFPIGKTSLWPKLFPGIRVQCTDVVSLPTLLLLCQRLFARKLTCVVAGLTASCLFKMPITREIALWAGGIDASRANAEYARS